MKRISFLVLLLILILNSCIDEFNDFSNAKNFNKENILGAWDIKKVTVNDKDSTESFKQKYFSIIQFFKKHTYCIEVECNEYYKYTYHYRIFPNYGCGNISINYGILSLSRALSVDSLHNDSCENNYYINCSEFYVYRDSCKTPIYNKNNWNIDFFNRGRFILSKKFNNKTYKIYLTPYSGVFLYPEIVYY